MKKVLLSIAAVVAVAGCGYLASVTDVPTEGPVDAATEITIDAGKGLAVDLCPIGVEYVNAVGASGGPIVAAFVKAATAAACASLEVALTDDPVPASGRSGAPVFCNLRPVNAGEVVALADGTTHIITAAEAAVFNAELTARCPS